MAEWLGGWVAEWCKGWVFRLCGRACNLNNEDILLIQEIQLSHTAHAHRDTKAPTHTHPHRAAITVATRH